MEHLDGKVAVITGAASGIGRAMAERFGRAGMALVLADIEEEPLDATAAALRGEGLDVTTAVCDVSRGEDIEALARTALEAHGAVHLLCNNAGVGGGGPMGQLTVDDWSWVLGVNLWGVIHGIRVFLPLLEKAGEGHIVNTASVAGLFSAPFMGPYNASKFAVVSLSETLCNELKMTGSEVGVSVLCPAWVRTRIHESARNRPASGESATPGAGLGEEPLALLTELVESGMEPAVVADQVLEAVVQRRFYILTHEGSAEAVQQRADAIVGGEDPPFLMPR